MRTLYQLLKSSSNSVSRLNSQIVGSQEQRQITHKRVCCKTYQSFQKITWQNESGTLNYTCPISPVRKRRSQTPIRTPISDGGIPSSGLSLKDRHVMQQVEPLIGIQASHLERKWVQVQGTLFRIQPPANGSGVSQLSHLGAEDPSGHSDGLPGSWLWPGQTVAGFEEINQPTEDIFLFLSPSLLLFKQIKFLKIFNDS